MADLACVGARSHVPEPRMTEMHHVMPKYLAHLLGVPERRDLVPLCGTCHNIVHAELDDLVSNGPRANRHHLAAGAWRLVSIAYSWWAGLLARQAT